MGFVKPKIMIKLIIYHNFGKEDLKLGNPFNRYQDYENETNKDAYEYEKRQYEREERYRDEISREIDREYFGEEE